MNIYLKEMGERAISRLVDELTAEPAIRIVAVLPELGREDIAVEQLKEVLLNSHTPGTLRRDIRSGASGQPRSGQSCAGSSSR